nr:actin nucleation-promoting factor WASL-like [Pongo abelii]
MAAFSVLRPRVPGSSGTWAADPDASTAVSPSLRFGGREPARPTRGGATVPAAPLPGGPDEGSSASGRGLLLEVPASASCPSPPAPTPCRLTRPRALSTRRGAAPPSPLRLLPAPSAGPTS